MNRRLAIAFSLLAPMLWARAQVVVVAPQGEYRHVKDSLTQHYYPGMFCNWTHTDPIVPTDGFFSYTSPMYEVYSPYDSIRCMFRIFFYGRGGTPDETKISRGYRNTIGMVSLQWNDFTHQALGYDTLRDTHIVDLRIRRQKKRYIFKLTGYALCTPPRYPKREVKRITARICYVPYLPGLTSAEFWVDHLPYGTKAKGVCYTEEERNSYLAGLREEREREESFNIRNRKKLERRSKKLRKPSKIERKWEELRSGGQEGQYPR